jgi:hypothetical protein
MPERRGMFLLKPAGYLRDRQGIFEMGGVWRDTGGVSQFMETQLAKICNQSKLHISFGYPKCKNPKSIQEMGPYDSTMAISKEFTVGLNVNN